MRHLVALLSLVSLLGCASPGPVLEPPSPLVEFKPELQVRVLWSAEVGPLVGRGDDRLVPLLIDDTIYTVNSRGQVTALNADDGRILWQTELRLPVTGATGGGGDLLVVGTRKGEVVALDRRDGKQRWAARVSSEVLAPPAAGQGIVVVQTVDGKLFGLAAEDGRRLWVHERTEPTLSLRGHAAPVLVSDYVLAGFASGKVAVLQLRDGRVLGEFAVAQPRGRNEIERLVDVDAAPRVVGDVLFAASYQGKVVAVDVRSGRTIWSRDASTYTGLEVDHGNVYLTDEKGYVLALDRQNGASLWRQDKLRFRSLNAPVYHAGHVVVGDFEGYVHWLARDDGRFTARYRLGSAPIHAPALVREHTLYVADRDGRLAALAVERR